MINSEVHDQYCTMTRTGSNFKALPYASKHLLENKIVPKMDTLCGADHSIGGSKYSRFSKGVADARKNL